MQRRAPLAVAATGFALLSMAVPFVSVAAGSDSVANGAELFATKGCAYCHGPAGVGGRVGPDLQLVRKRLDAQAISRQIHQGGKAMPAFGDQLTEQQIEDLVAFLRAKRKVVPVPVKPAAPVAPPAPAPDPN